MASEYFLLFKSAEAEFRAWTALPVNMKQHVFPIIELTRGRKIPKTGKNIPQEQWSSIAGIYNFSGTIKKVREAFKSSKHVILDLTREEELTCFEIEDLSASDNGYDKWVQFLKLEKDNFRDIIPTLLINPAVGENEQQFKANIGSQLDKLMNEFSGVAYRASILLDPDPASSGMRTRSERSRTTSEPAAR